MTYDMVRDNAAGSAYRYVPGNFVDRRSFEIPVMAQFYLLMSKNVSFGIQGFADFNRVRTTEGFSLSFAFGRMRTRNGKIAQPKVPPPRPPGLF